MRTENRHFRSRIGSVVIEAAIAVSLFMVLICAAISSVTAVNAELYMQRASENVVSELNVVIPLASNGISCADDLVSAFGVADNVSFDTYQLDDALGVIGSASGVTGVDLEDLVGTALFGRSNRNLFALKEPTPNTVVTYTDSYVKSDPKVFFLYLRRLFKIDENYNEDIQNELF